MSEYMSGLPSFRSTLTSLTVVGTYVMTRERIEWEGADGATRSQVAPVVYEVFEGRIRRIWSYPATEDPSEISWTPGDVDDPSFVPGSPGAHPVPGGARPASVLAGAAGGALPSPA